MRASIYSAVYRVAFMVNDPPRLSLVLSVLLHRDSAASYLAAAPAGADMPQDAVTTNNTTDIALKIYFMSMPS
jgi:hypothetical protein